MVSTTCRCATGAQTSSATWMAVKSVRFWWQDGHVQRCLLGQRQLAETTQYVVVVAMQQYYILCHPG